jgi:cytochrome c oxidase subunit IV
METEKVHIIPYPVYAKVLLALLLLTSLTVCAAWLDLKQGIIVIAMLIASVKAFLVLTWFMHLKYDLLLFRLLVGMVALLIFIIFVLLFFDYLFR